MSNTCSFPDFFPCLLSPWNPSTKRVYNYLAAQGIGVGKERALLRANTGGVRKVHRNSVGKHSEVLASDLEINVPSLGSFLESQDIQTERGLEEC